MINNNLDTLYINDLTVFCIIGVFENERREKQPVIINVTLSVDTKKAGKTDKLEDTVNYHNIALTISKKVSDSKFYLLEKLAQTVADICLTDQRIKQVVVRIDKPKALNFAKSSAIEILRINE